MSPLKPHGPNEFPRGPPLAPPPPAKDGQRSQLRKNRLAVWGIYGDAARTQAILGATQPSGRASSLTVFVVEALMTFFLVLVICSVATDKRAHPAIGGVLGALLYNKFLATAQEPGQTEAAPEPSRATVG